MISVFVFVLGFLGCRRFRSQFRFSGVYLVVKLRVKFGYFGLVYDGVYGLAVMVVLIVFFLVGCPKSRPRSYVWSLLL